MDAAGPDHALSAQVERLTTRIDELIEAIPAARAPAGPADGQPAGSDPAGDEPLSALDRLDELPDLARRGPRVVLAEIGLDMTQSPPPDTWSPGPGSAPAPSSPPQSTNGNGNDNGPLAGHALTPVLLAGPHRGFTREVRRMVAVRGAATAFGATAAWVAGWVTPVFPGRASTMGLVALIATQLAQTAWSGRRSSLVLATVAGSLAVLVITVQTPGLSWFFGCTPLDPLSWAVVLGCAVDGAAGAELVPRLVGTPSR